MRSLCWRILGLAITLSASVQAFEFVSSRGTGFGQAILLSRPTASDLVNLPASRIGVGSWQIETGYNRAFDMSELDQLFLAGAGRRGRYTIAAGISQFGESDLYTEQVFKLSVAAQVDSFSAGVGGSLQRLSFGRGYGNLSAMTLHLAAGYTRNWLLTGVSVDNLMSPQPAAGSPRSDPVFSLFAEYRGKRALSLAGRITAQRMERPRFSLGQHIGIGRYAAITLGVITSPFQFGGGVEFAIKGSRITYGASVHPVLGLSQTISVAYGRGDKAAGGGRDFE